MDMPKLRCPWDIQVQVSSRQTWAWTSGGPPTLTPFPSVTMLLHGNVCHVSLVSSNDMSITCFDKS